MRFKLDENLPSDAVKLLRDAGHDALSVLDQGMGGSADHELVKICSSEQRALMTFDIDFANIRAYPPSDYAGLIVFRLLTQEKNHLLSVLEKLISVLETTSPSGQLWIVEEDRIRIRD